MLTQNHQLDPETEDIDTSLENAREIEELRFAKRAMVMVDRYLDDPEPRVLDLLHHLEADHAARLAQLDLIENRPPHQAEITVDVADGQPEHQRDDVVVHPSDDDAVKRIRSADLVPV